MTGLLSQPIKRGGPDDRPKFPSHGNRKRPEDRFFVGSMSIQDSFVDQHRNQDANASIGSSSMAGLPNDRCQFFEGIELNGSAIQESGFHRGTNSFPRFVFHGFILFIWRFIFEFDAAFVSLILLLVYLVIGLRQEKS